MRSFVHTYILKLFLDANFVPMHGPKTDWTSNIPKSTHMLPVYHLLACQHVFCQHVFCACFRLSPLLASISCAWFLCQSWGLYFTSSIDCHSSLHWNFHLCQVCQVQWWTILLQKTTSWKFTTEFCYVEKSDYQLVDLGTIFFRCSLTSYCWENIFSWKTIISGTHYQIPSWRQIPFHHLSGF